uniref:Uncharacterized protein n=1 Tax=Oryza glaberrima TaxID=4538 RepID=I1QIF0_ORYGL
MVFTEKRRGRGSVLPLLRGHPSTCICLAIGCRPPTALRAQQPAAASAHAAHPVSLAVASALAAHPAILTTANPLNTATEIAKQVADARPVLACRALAVAATPLGQRCRSASHTLVHRRRPPSSPSPRVTDATLCKRASER